MYAYHAKIRESTSSDESMYSIEITENNKENDGTERIVMITGDMIFFKDLYKQR